MKHGKAKDAYITVPEAARILKVSSHTIYKWCAKGRLTCKERYVGKMIIRYVLVSSMKRAKEDICEMCGNIFERHHYTGARFCSHKCRIEWHLSKRRKYPFIGRPPRTRKGILRKWRESLRTYPRLKHNRKSYTKFLRPS